MTFSGGRTSTEAFIRTSPDLNALLQANEYDVPPSATMRKGLHFATVQ
jgi:hypothetical protein